MTTQVIVNSRARSLVGEITPARANRDLPPRIDYLLHGGVGKVSDLLRFGTNVVPCMGGGWYSRNNTPVEYRDRLARRETRRGEFRHAAG